MKKMFNLLVVLATAFWLFSCSSGAGDADDLSGEIGGVVKPIIIPEVTDVDPGSELPISWEVTADQPSTVVIEISRDGGQTWEAIETSFVNTGTYDLQVPPIPGAEMRVRVVPNEGSEDVIAITPIFETDPVKDIEIADSATSFQPGQTASISWEHEEYQPDTLTLTYCAKITETHCDDPENWVIIDNAVANNTPTDGTTNSVEFDVPFDPGVEIIVDLQGDYNGTAVTYGSIETTIDPIIANNITVGSGSDVTPGSDVSMNWEHDEIQPDTLTLVYCVPVEGVEDCSTPVFDGSNPNWVIVDTNVDNSDPGLGANNSLDNIGVPYIPGESIQFVLGGTVDDNTYVFAESGVISVESDQAMVIGALHGGGGLQKATSDPVDQSLVGGLTEGQKTAFSRISIEARVAPYIAPTQVCFDQNAAPTDPCYDATHPDVSGNDPKYQKITVKAFVKGVN